MPSVPAPRQCARPSEGGQNNGRDRSSGVWFPLPARPALVAALRVNGEEHRESSTMTDKREAEKLLAKREAALSVGILTAPDTKRVTFDDLADMVRADYRVRGGRSTATLEGSLANLKAFFGSCRALSITSDRITTFEQERLEAGAARATVNKELACSVGHSTSRSKLAAYPHLPSHRFRRRIRTTLALDSSRRPISAR